MNRWKKITKKNGASEYEAFVCASDCRQKRLVQKKDAIGRPWFTEQCVTCGKSGSALSKAKVAEIVATGITIEEFDENLATDAQKELSALHLNEHNQRLAEIEKEKEERRAFYNEYIQSDKWKLKREAILERDNYTCRGCLTRRASHVHHLTYKHLGDELAYELISVCVQCHEKEHPHMRDSEAAQ